MSTPLKIGFIGTGIMGAPMAGRLAEAGHGVRAWNRSKDKSRALSGKGVETSSTPAEAVDDTDIVIVMLSSGPVCDEIILGEEDMLASMKPNSTLVVMSSIPVGTAQGQAKACEERHIRYLDAPVSGGEKGAIEGTLAIMVGGEEAAFDNARPVLECMGSPIHVGPVGSGELAKLANQMIVANTIATVAEALLLAERGGADPARVRQALLGGFADSTILRQHGQRMIEGDFRPGGPAKWQLKDTQTADSLAAELTLELPVSSLVNRLFEDLVNHGDGELDHSSLIRELRRRNGLPL